MIYIGSDHAGFELKSIIVSFLKEQNLEVKDLGPHKYEVADDYPDYAIKVAEKVAENIHNKGILICSTGQGMATAANKVKGIIASTAWDTDTAGHACRHNHANVLTLGQSKVNPETAKEMVLAWLNGTEENSERHIRRKNKVIAIENKYMK